MQEVTYVNEDDEVKNPCWNCKYDCPRLCDYEVCEEDEDDFDEDDLNDDDF